MNNKTQFKWAATILTALTMSISAPTLAAVCKVTDPTGTPLNARQQPQGRIIGKVNNGRVVYIADTRIDQKGKTWALVFDARTDQYIGWVFREFISCY